MKTKEDANYVPSTVTGKFVMALVPGLYTITVESPGYKMLVDNIEVYDKGSFKPEMKKDYQLVKEGTVVKTPPVNIPKK